MYRVIVNGTAQRRNVSICAISKNFFYVEHPRTRGQSRRRRFVVWPRLLRSNFAVVKTKFKWQHREVFIVVLESFLTLDTCLGEG
jgi:macrodomain Ter protein organizer (MatP/YcbG family)